MDIFRTILIIVVILNYCHMTESRKSAWFSVFDQNNRDIYTVFPNTLFKGSYISLHMICSTNATNQHIKVSWILQELECMEEMYHTERKNPMLAEALGSVTYDMLQSSDHLIIHPDRIVRSNADTEVYNETIEGVPQRKYGPGPGVTTVKFMLSEPQVMDCAKDNFLTLQDESASPYYIGYFRQNLSVGDPDRFTWRKIPSDWTHLKEADNRVAGAWENGIYHFGLKIEPEVEPFDYRATVMVKMMSKGGYLPAIEWPLLPVRGVLSFLYLAVGSGWIFIWARSHQHSLKIHVVIGAVAVAGGLANTVSFVELSTQHSTGNGLQGMRWIGMFLTVLQSGLMYLLIMIVSTGYQITRPSLHKSLLASALCLATALSLSQFLSFIVLDEDIKIKYSYGVFALTVNIVYFVFSVVIAGWMMIFSMMTFAHLCKRKHSSKKIIGFTIFTASCMFTFIVNLTLGLVSLGITRECSKDWRMEWLSESYGSMTALMVLVVLMWLWRPVDEAQSYAFTPLNTDDIGEPGDFDDDEDDNTIYEKVSLEIMNG